MYTKDIRTDGLSQCLSDYHRIDTADRDVLPGPRGRSSKCLSDTFGWARERQEDLDHEEQLARDAVEDETDAWPWYADAPLEVEESEIVEDADLLGLPVDGRDEDFDDELTVEALEAEITQ